LSKANRNAILKIAFDGKEKDREVILRDYQRNPLTRKYDHLDFQAIDMTQPLQVEVDIHLVGEPIGRKTGAVLTVQLKTLRIECLAAKIPPAVEVEVSHLNAGDSLHVSDITAGSFKIVSNPKLTVCQMSLIKEEAVEATAVAATPDAAAAGAPAAAGAAPAAAAPEAKKDAKKEGK
jgi:large subunit ribosomal protein L25